MSNKTTTTSSSKKVWTPNPTQKAILDFLTANAGKSYTLAEIAENIGADKIATGTMNTLGEGKNGKGLVHTNKDARVEVCPTCGHKHKLSTYEIVDEFDDEDTAEDSEEDDEED